MDALIRPGAVWHSLEDAGRRVFRTAPIVAAWAAAGAVYAYRHPTSGVLYVEEDSLLRAERADRLGQPLPAVHPAPLTLRELPAWLAAHGRPTSERAVRDWIEERHLVAVVPGARGRGKAARYDPIAALLLADQKTRRGEAQPRRADPIATIRAHHHATC